MTKMVPNCKRLYGEEWINNVLFKENDTSAISQYIYDFLEKCILAKTPILINDGCTFCRIGDKKATLVKLAYKYNLPIIVTDSYSLKAYNEIEKGIYGPSFGREKIKYVWYNVLIYDVDKNDDDRKYKCSDVFLIDFYDLNKVVHKNLGYYFLVGFGDFTWSRGLQIDRKKISVVQ